MESISRQNASQFRCQYVSRLRIKAILEIEIRTAPGISTVGRLISWLGLVGFFVFDVALGVTVDGV
jgi:hypothetical protein